MNLILFQDLFTCFFSLVKAPAEALHRADAERRPSSGGAPAFFFFGEEKYHGGIENHGKTMKYHWFIMGIS